MPPSLYPFQIEALAAIRSGHAEHQRILLSLPTGSGKTRVAATYAKEHFLDRGLGVLWVAHTEELLDQAYECFVDILGFDRSQVLRLYAGKERLETNPDARLCFMSNLCRSGPGNVDLLVVDEAHRAAAATYTDWMSIYKTYRTDGSKVLGLTATPYRLHEGQNESLLNFKFSRPPVRVFEKMAYRKSFCDLVRIGRVAPFRQVRVDSDLTFDMRKENGDFAGASLEKLNTPVRNKLIFNNWRQNRTKYGKTLIFVGTQDHARALAALFGSDGDYAVSADGKEGRRDAVKKFRSGAIQVLVNVRILSEGVDVPDIKTVMLARPTLSPNLFMQMVGRGSRICPGKSFFYLVDIHDQLPNYEDYLVGVQDLADRDEGLLQVVERKARAAEKLSASRASELAQDKAVWLEIAAEPIATITRRFTGWISFSTADGEAQPVGTLLTADEFAVMARLAPGSDRISPQKARDLENIQGSDALRKCKECLADDLWGRLGRFSELPVDELEVLQNAATDDLNLNPGGARRERDFSQQILQAASRWGVKPKTVGYCVEQVSREPDRAAVVIKLEKDKTLVLLILGAPGAAVLREAIRISRTGRADFAATTALGMDLAKAEPRLGTDIIAILHAVTKHADLADYCLFREQ